MNNSRRDLAHPAAANHGADQAEAGEHHRVAFRFRNRGGSGVNVVDEGGAGQVAGVGDNLQVAEALGGDADAGQGEDHVGRRVLSAEQIGGDVPLAFGSGEQRADVAFAGKPGSDP